MSRPLPRLMRSGSPSSRPSRLHRGRFAKVTACFGYRFGYRFLDHRPTVRAGGSSTYSPVSDCPITRSSRERAHRVLLIAVCPAVPHARLPIDRLARVGDVADARYRGDQGETRHGRAIVIAARRGIGTVRAGWRAARALSGATASVRCPAGRVPGAGRRSPAGHRFGWPSQRSLVHRIGGCRRGNAVHHRHQFDRPPRDAVSAVARAQRAAWTIQRRCRAFLYITATAAYRGGADMKRP